MKLHSSSFRWAVPDDIAALKDLYPNTVLTTNRRDYSEPEVTDWVSCGDDLSRWKRLIETLYFIIAESPQSQIIGFSSISPLGYLHSMFVHKDFQGEGIATMLLEEIERYAKECRIEKITSEVSITARPFFERKNYPEEARQKRRANQLYLKNFLMTRTIDKI